MCGITGWIDWKKDLTQHPSLIENMTETLIPRGPDASGTWISPHCALGHRRLSVIDPENGAQPMYRKLDSKHVVIVYNGELYNALELRDELMRRGHRFDTHCDTEVLLVAYLEWGKACVEKLNGIFAFAVWDDREQALFLARDRVGVKPLFYAEIDGGFLFGSEPKAILANPAFRAEAGPEELSEILMVGPAKTPGRTVFRNMLQLRPGTCATYGRDGFRAKAYWKLEAREHTDSVEETAEKVYQLLKDTVERQLVSDVPVCTLLSGGLDSSALSTFAANYYKEHGKGALDTFSVDYVDNDKHFKQNVFQPNSDNAYIRMMTDFLGTRHHNVVFDTPELMKVLPDTMQAYDYPGMLDIDASLMMFCGEIKKTATVAISGEAADEVFGGYPWFHREEALHADTFPWNMRLAEREAYLSPEFVSWARPAEYAGDRYLEALNEVPALPGEDEEAAKMRRMSYLNITRFMPTLLDRKDRMSMAVGLEVRVPFCDHRLIEYVFNIPWSIKTAGGREKGILRQALKGWMPDEIVFRKKSPYPKSHNPDYLEATRKWFLETIADTNAPLRQFIHVEKLRQFAEEAYSTNFHWFSQLMATPQLFAYLALTNEWLKNYRVSIVG